MKWIEFDINERKAMIQGVVAQYGIDEAAASHVSYDTPFLRFGEVDANRLCSASVE